MGHPEQKVLCASDRRVGFVKGWTIVGSCIEGQGVMQLGAADTIAKGD